MTDSAQTDAQAASTAPTAVMKGAQPLIVPTQQPSELVPSLSVLAEHHGDFATFHEGYVSRYIELADSKASFVFGGTSALIGYLFSQSQIQSVLVTPAWSPVWVLLACTLALLSISVVCSFLVIAPRLATSGEGIVFFGAVAARPSAQAYEGELARLAANDVLSARVRHCYDLSRICSRKYEYLRKAMWLAFPGVASAVCVLLLT